MIRTRHRFVPGFPIRPARMAVMILCAVIGGGMTAPALAQEGEPETAASSGECPVSHCLRVAPPASLAKAADPDDAIAIADLADGLTLTYQGETPFPVHLVAARYDGGRLVRYGVSSRTVLKTAGEGLTIADAEKALREAFAPITSKPVAIRRLTHDRLQPEEAITGQAFIGEVPAAYLAGTDPVGLVPLEDIAADTIGETFPGSIGVLIVLPEDGSLRGKKDARLKAAVFRLDYGDKPMETAESG